MSDDLISRKALIRAMEKKYDIAKATGMYPTGLSEAFIITEGIISEQPTACDVDKVAESIRSEIRCVMDTYCGSLPDDAFLDLETLEQETIEKIVKAGGKE